MNYLNDLFNKIEKSDIVLYSTTSNCVDAASIEFKNNYAIFLNDRKITNSGEFFVKAAHEYGHCATGALHKLSSPYDVIEKHERLADQKSVEDFLPPEIITNAVNHGCQQIYEIAEYTGFPEPFVKKAIEIYKLKGEI